MFTLFLSYKRFMFDSVWVISRGRYESDFYDVEIGVLPFSFSRY